MMMFLLQKPDPQIADFLAPLPLEVCVDRLQSRQGKFFDIDTDIQIKQIDANQHGYQMSVLRSERNVVPLKVYGTLKRQDETTTLVLVSRDYELDIVPIVKYTFSCVVLGLVFGMLLNLPIILILMIPVGVFIGMFVDRFSDKYDPVVLMIQETLNVHTPHDKAK